MDEMKATPKAFGGGQPVSKETQTAATVDLGRHPEHGLFTGRIVARPKTTKRTLSEMGAKLKEACALRGTPVTIKNWGDFIRVRPCKDAQYWAPDVNYPVFRSISLRIVREEAIALGFTHVRGAAIDPEQCVEKIQENLYLG